MLDSDLVFWELWSGLSQGKSCCQYAVWVVWRVAGQRTSNRCRLIIGRVLQDRLGMPIELGGSQRIAASVKQGVALLLFWSFLRSNRSSDVDHTQRIHFWVASGVHQVVKSSGGFMDQCWHAVGVFGVTFEGSVGWGGAGSRAIAKSGPQVILQTFNIFRVTDSEQLVLLLRAQEGFQDRGVVVEASMTLHRHGQHWGEYRGRYFSRSFSRSSFRLRDSGMGGKREEAMWVEVRVAQPNGGRFDGGGHHHCCLWLAGGLWDALWIVRISTGFVDFTKVTQVVVEGWALFGPVLVLQVGHIQPVQIFNLRPLRYESFSPWVRGHVTVWQKTH